MNKFLEDYSASHSSFSLFAQWLDQPKQVTHPRLQLTVESIRQQAGLLVDEVDHIVMWKVYDLLNRAAKSYLQLFEL